MADSYPAMPEAIEALASDDNVSVNIERLLWTWFNPDYYVFTPREKEPIKGFIIYPGGNIDSRAYAPTAHAIASEGFLAFIVPMPFDLAVYGYKRAHKIVRVYNDVKKWAIGGHSLGGSMACKYAKNFTDMIDGVALWASYPSELFRIDNTALKVISIYGTKDGLVTLDEIEESREHLPPDTQFVEIKGGNHTYFGWYGDPDGEELQEGDNPADITRQGQQEQIIEATVDFLNQL